MKKKIVYALAIALGICITGCGKEAKIEEKQEKVEIMDEDTGNAAIKDIHDKVNENAVPEYYAIYSDLLHQFMNGEDAYFMNNDHAVSYIEQDGVFYSQNFSFGLYDINKDDIKELIVVAGNDFLNGSVANIIIPKENWQDANICEISYIDVNSGKVASLISDLGDVVTYYDYDGDKLNEYDSFHYEMHAEGDNTYYHGNNEVISEEEYSNQDAFNWDGLDIPFYYLSEANIDFILNGTIADDKNASWKQAYIPIVKQWDIMHSNDYSYGYELIYVDDNDVPELALACDDEAWTGYDIYTCIDGEAVQLRFEDGIMEQCMSKLVSPGWQGKGDYYIEKSGVYMQGSGMMGSYNLDGYALEGNILKKVFNYSYYDTSWDESVAEPYGYTIEYIDDNGKRIINEVTTDGDDKYYDITGVPEAAQIENIYHCDFEKSKSFNCTMNYKTICSILGVDDGATELSYKEIFAKLLYEYMKDNTKSIQEGCDGFNYQNDGGKFMLKDINNDGIDEMLLTVMGQEYNVFIPADTWKESYVGNITAYSDDGILEWEYGETFTHYYSYYRLEDGELKHVEHFRSFDNDATGEMEYTHADAAGNENIITEAEFNAGDGLYEVHGIEGEWSDISEENINRILLQENNEAVSTQADETRYVTTAANDGGVNMRSGPGTEYDKVVEMIPNGEKMAVSDEAFSTTGKTWYKVTYHEVEGWVSASQVK